MTTHIGELFVSPVVYRVERNPNLDEGVVGRMSYIHGAIQLMPGLPAPQAEATFWHELFHTMLKHDAIDLTDAQEEMVCDTLSMGMVRLRMDNPNLEALIAGVRNIEQPF